LAVHDVCDVLYREYLSPRDTDVMGKAFWFPTKWSAVRSRPGSKLLARRVARRGTPEFKALFPRRWVLETVEGPPLEITQERPRHVQEQLFVYTNWPETSLARRADSNPELPSALWVDAHSLVQPCWVDWPAPERRAIHEWPAALPAESEHGEWLGVAEDVTD